MNDLALFALAIGGVAFAVPAAVFLVAIVLRPSRREAVWRAMNDEALK